MYNIYIVLARMCNDDIYLFIYFIYLFISSLI